MYDSREVITLGSIHWGDYERINDNIKELSRDRSPGKSSNHSTTKVGTGRR